MLMGKRTGLYRILCLLCILVAAGMAYGQIGNAAVYAGFYRTQNTIQLTPVLNVSVTKNSYIEGRYNYEMDRTASFYCGHNLINTESNGITRRCSYYAGVSLGAVRSVIPGFQLWLRNRNFDFFYQNQLLISTIESQKSIYTNWSQFMWRADDQLSIGLSTQVNQPLSEKLQHKYINSGMMFNINIKSKWDLSLYTFEFWNPNRYVLVGLAYEISR